MSFLWTAEVVEAGHDALSYGGSPSLHLHSANVMVPSMGPSLLKAVLDAQREAAEHLAFESFAAERIQSAYRMHKARCAFQRHHKAILDIQRVYRGARQRRATRRLLQTEEQRYTEYLFHYYATRIQSVFRGFASRKHTCDFYARKAYVDAVTQESDAVRALVNDFHEEQATLEALQAHMRESGEYSRATARVHYLLSTAAVSGVYRRPLSMTGTATTFGTNVEEDVHRNAADRRRPIIEAEMRKNASVPVRPTASSLPASTRNVRKTHSRPANTPPPPTCSSEVVRDGTGPNKEACANSVGLAATLPPIYGHRERTRSASGRTTNDVYAPSATCGASSCAWENPDARPAPRPLVDPADATVKASKKTNNSNSSAVSTTQKVPRRPAGDGSTATRRIIGSPANVASSFSKKFKVSSHDCRDHEQPSATATTTAAASATGNSSALQPTYDHEPAALAKSVDAKLIQSLHGDAVFKVRAQK